MLEHARRSGWRSRAARRGACRSSAATTVSVLGARHPARRPRQHQAHHPLLGAGQRRRASRAPRSPPRAVVDHRPEQLGGHRVAVRAAGRRAAWRACAHQRVERLRRHARAQLGGARRVLEHDCAGARPSRRRPRTAARPVRHSKSTQPSEKTSARASMSRSPRACSGAMYPGVPSSAPVRVSSLRFVEQARDAEVEDLRPRRRRRSTRKRLLGLMSRWTTPARCATPSASATRRSSPSAASDAEAPAREALGQGLALEPLHRQVAPPSPVAPCAT